MNQSALVLKSEVLEDDRTLSEYKIKNGNSVDAVHNCFTKIYKFIQSLLF